VCLDTACFDIGQHNSNGVCLTDAELATSPLHCGACDNACASNEVCVQGNCERYFPSPACTTCPCAACGAGTSCCTYPGESFAVCVNGNTCP
jgi:hypothetical protein